MSADRLLPLTPQLLLPHQAGSVSIFVSGSLDDHAPGVGDVPEVVNDEVEGDEVGGLSSPPQSFTRCFVCNNPTNAVEGLTLALSWALEVKSFEESPFL